MPKLNQKRRKQPLPPNACSFGPPPPKVEAGGIVEQTDARGLERGRGLPRCAIGGRTDYHLEGMPSTSHGYFSARALTP